MPLQLFLFKGGSNYEQTFTESYDAYVRAERAEDVLPMILKAYDWLDAVEYPNDPKGNVEMYADGGIEVLHIKDYPEDTPHVAGVIPWDDVEALL
ncbi:hypothetical protein [Methylobacterium iners]|uniref:Uncharacterized protein n=1 Tax=Methylobacterium iners TaxID=418707 RepID=A0ABQ4RYM1_9HYPH|nr:hypothetical protein [Methylobacterium iners]GJD94784.1 hypothetical protein OCOJLMKI_1988 [Methylobacterium iners]